MNGIGDPESFVNAAAKSYALLKEILRDLGNIYSIIPATASKRKGKRIADGAAVLRFESDYFVRLLKEIKAGNVSGDAIGRISGDLERTATEVESSLRMLDGPHKNYLTSKYGPRYWEVLDERIIVIKTDIRRELYDLASGARNETPNTTSDKAQSLLLKIAKFNADLAEFREKIAPPSAAT